MTRRVEGLLRREGFSTERFDIEHEGLHGTAGLGGTLNLYLAKLVCEEESVFVSFANPYLLQEVPRVGTYINAYSCNGSTIRAVMDKLLGRSVFRGVSPLGPFCGLPDARL